MSDEPEIRYLGDMQRLSLKPGDKLVLTVKGRLSQDMAARIGAHMKQFVGDVPVIVLEEGMTIGAIGAEVEA